MRPSCVLFSLAILLACHSEGGPESDTRAYQSVEMLFDSTKECFSLSSEPHVVVGLDESLPLHRVRGAVFFGGGLAIANSGSNEVLILDGLGHLVNRQGGSGSGPGEYVTLAGVVRHADGLVTWDAYLRRLASLDSDGRYIGGTRLSPEGHLWTFPRIVGALENSVLLEFLPLGFLGDGAVGPLEVRQDVEFVVVRLSDGKELFNLSLPGEESWAERRLTPNGMNGSIPVIFGRNTVAAVAHGRFLIADNDSLSFTNYNETGRLDDVSLGLHGIPATEEWERRVRDTIRAYARTRTQRLGEFRLDLLEGVPARSTLPAFSDLVGGSDGRLWVREYPRPTQDQVMWVAFNEDYQVEKRVLIPEALHVLDLAEDRALVQAEGEYGEETVEVYLFVDESG